MTNFRKLLLETMEKHIEHFLITDDPVEKNDMTLSDTFMEDGCMYCIILLSYDDSKGTVDTDKFEVTVSFSFDEPGAIYEDYSLDFKGELSEQNMSDLESRFDHVVSTLPKIREEMKLLMAETGLKKPKS